MIEQHYTGPELAARLHCHPETIRRAAVAGKLRSVRVGAERRYPESAIEEWLGLDQPVQQEQSGQVVSLDRRAMSG